MAERDFDVAISYLFRRLEENAADENFIHHLFGLRPGTAAFEAEAAKFRSCSAPPDVDVLNMQSGLFV